MKYDIILCGVGGQGVLSIAAIIAKAAMKNSLNVRQSEVHGMSQRGGAVLAHLRISDEKIAGDLVPKGEAQLIISMEPLESLRYIEYLNTTGRLITSSTPFVNIPNYPDIEQVYQQIKKFNKSILVDSEEIAKSVGSPKSANMVLIGAASKSLPIKNEAFIEAISETFARKGEDIVNANIKAFNLGQEKDV